MISKYTFKVKPVIEYQFRQHHITSVFHQTEPLLRGRSLCRLPCVKSFFPLKIPYQRCLYRVYLPFLITSILHSIHAMFSRVSPRQIWSAPTLLNRCFSNTCKVNYLLYHGEISRSWTIWVWWRDFYSRF